MLDVSVAWVRLGGVRLRCDVSREKDLGFAGPDLLRVEIQMRAIDLVEAP